MERFTTQWTVPSGICQMIKRHFLSQKRQLSWLLWQFDAFRFPSTFTDINNLDSAFLTFFIIDDHDDDDYDDGDDDNVNDNDDDHNKNYYNKGNKLHKKFTFLSFYVLLLLSSHFKKFSGDLYVLFFFSHTSTISRLWDIQGTHTLNPFWLNNICLNRSRSTVLT